MNHESRMITQQTQGCM